MVCIKSTSSDDIVLSLMFSYGHRLTPTYILRFCFVFSNLSLYIYIKQGLELIKKRKTSRLELF